MRSTMKSQCNKYKIHNYKDNHYISIKFLEKKYLKKNLIPQKKSKLKIWHLEKKFSIKFCDSIGLEVATLRPNIGLKVATLRPKRNI